MPMMVPQFLVLVCFAVVVCVFLFCAGLLMRSLSGCEVLLSSLS